MPRFQVALPMARRPLFPGFWKAVAVKNIEVVTAIKDVMKCSKPYLGVSLKDKNMDSDIITDADPFQPVGVFSKITSVFAALG